jgi:hypothetical protein
MRSWTLVAYDVDHNASTPQTGNQEYTCCCKSLVTCGAQLKSDLRMDTHLDA